MAIRDRRSNPRRRTAAELLPRVVLIPLFVLAVVAQSTAHAQDSPSTPSGGRTAGCRVLSQGCRSLELYVQYFVEAWNLNGRRKTTLPGVAAVLSAGRANGWGVLFVEGGLGASYSTVIVPEHGTRFNYLVQGGLGMATYFGPHAGTMLCLRWFHLSNLSLNGPHHNPDIEALGARGGLFVAF